MTKYPRPEWAKNSPHPYGLLSMQDYPFLERWLDKIGFQFGSIQMLEIGVANGATLYGICEFCERKIIPLEWTGIDLPGVGPAEMPPGCKFIAGRSEEVYVKIDGPFNLVIIDGDHSSNAVCLDFLNYAPMVVKGGIIMAHDTINHPGWIGLAHPGSYQGHGPQHADFGIGVRAALKKLGLLDNLRSDWTFVDEQTQGTVQGYCVFRKLT